MSLGKQVPELPKCCASIHSYLSLLGSVGAFSPYLRHIIRRSSLPGYNQGIPGRCTYFAPAHQRPCPAAGSCFVGAVKQWPATTADEISRTIHSTYIASLLESLCMSLLSGCICPPATTKTYLLRQRSCRPTSRGWIFPCLQTTRLSFCRSGNSTRRRSGPGL